LSLESFPNTAVRRDHQAIGDSETAVDAMVVYEQMKDNRTDFSSAGAESSSGRLSSTFQPSSPTIKAYSTGVLSEQASDVFNSVAEVSRSRRHLKLIEVDVLR